jgi:hypothetical protein
LVTRFPNYPVTLSMKIAKINSGKATKGKKLHFVQKWGTRFARFFLVQNTKTGKIYQITTNFTKCP